MIPKMNHAKVARMIANAILEEHKRGIEYPAKIITMCLFITGDLA